MLIGGGFKRKFCRNLESGKEYGNIWDLKQVKKTVGLNFEEEIMFIWGQLCNFQVINEEPVEKDLKVSKCFFNELCWID